MNSDNLSANNENFSLKFKRLPLHLRLIFIGITGSTLGIFLPWYKDLDSFKNGVTFIGLTGPTLFVGYSLLVMNLISISVLLKYIKQNSRNTLNEQKHSIENWIGIFSIYILVAVGLFYTSDYFGEPLSRKSLGIGYYICLAGAVISFLGLLLFKEKKKIVTVNDSIDIDEKNQLVFEQFEETFTSELQNNINVATHKLVDNLVFEKDPVSKELLKKQKEIEAKIYNKK